MRKHEYNTVIDELSAQLYRYAFHFLRNQEDAKDIIQDVFEKMWLNRKTIDLETVKPWLYRCTHNAMVNYTARKSRTSYMSNQELPTPPTPFDSSFESMQVVERMVNILPPNSKKYYSIERHRRLFLQGYWTYSQFVCIPSQGLSFSCKSEN
ncbi:RNA polymerase sigma factor [Crocinitomicaceae bacterium]|nr:RNA polymerase sigma factor [Crocinitomicaceae bacterium]